MKSGVFRLNYLSKSIIALVTQLMAINLCYSDGNQYPLTKGGTVGSFSISPDGKSVIFDKTPHDPNLHLMLLGNGQIKTIKPPLNRRWHMARWSPDGNQVVITSAGYKNEVYDLNDMQIALVDISNGSIRTLTSGPGVKITPFFSSNGADVFYFKGRVRQSGKTPAAWYDLYQINLASGSEQRLTNEEFYQMIEGDSSPNSAQVVFAGVGAKRFPSTKVGDNFLFIYHLKEGYLEKKETGVLEARQPRYSKDGSIYFVGAESQRGRFYFGVFKLPATQSLASKVIDVVPNPIAFDLDRAGNAIYLNGRDSNHNGLEKIPLPSSQQKGVRS